MLKISKHIGSVYGLWTVIEHVKGKKYLAKCECGTVKEIWIDNLTSGRSTNCGCVQRENNKKRMTTHGDSKSKLYNVWAGMKRRCYNKNQKSYKDYGEKGIIVCSEWIDSYENFKIWVINNGYKEGLEIDRINVFGNYEPDNCRWITKRQNANNKRNNTIVEINGVSHTISEWADISGISSGMIASRLNRGWNKESLLDDVFSHGDGKFSDVHLLDIRGEMLTLHQISDKYNIKYGTLISRFNKGLRGEDLIVDINPRNTPKKVACFKDDVLVKEFNSIKDAAKEFKLNRTNISNCCKGKRKTCGGFQWKFI